MIRISHLSIFVAFLSSACSSGTTRGALQSADSVAVQDLAYDSLESSSQNAELYESAVDVSRTDAEISTGSLPEIQGEQTEGEVEVEVEPSMSYELTGLWGTEVASAQAYAVIKELDEFAGQAVVPIAHFNRGARHVIVVWPLLSAEGTLMRSANVYGVCLEQSDDGLEQCGPTWEVEEIGLATAAVESALGGSDYEVVNDQSHAALDELGPHLIETGNAFVSAASRGQAQAAFDAACAFVELLPVEEVAFSNFIERLLVNASIHGDQFEYIKTEQGDLLSSITFKVRRSWLEAKTMTLTAQQVAGSSESWAIVDYW